MKIEQKNTIEGQDFLKLAVFDFHGVVVRPGVFRESQIKDKDIEELRRKAPSGVFRTVPFDPPLSPDRSDWRGLLRSALGSLEKVRLRKQYIDNYDLRPEVRDTMIDLSAAGVKLTVCSSLLPNTEDALREFLLEVGIWPRLNRELPAALKAQDSYSSLAYKCYAVEEVLSKVEQYFIISRPEKRKYKRQVAIVEDNVNIAIPTSRLMRKRNGPWHKYYIPLDQSSPFAKINKKLWPESVRDMPDHEDNYVFDPDLAIMREDFGLAKAA